MGSSTMNRLTMHVRDGRIGQYIERIRGVDICTNMTVSVRG